MSNASAAPEVMIVTDSFFPTGDADANNLQGHCRAIAGAGFGVGVLSKLGGEKAEDRAADGTYRFRGTPYWPVHDLKGGSRMGRLLRSHFACGDRRLEWLRNDGLRGTKAVVALPGTGGTVAFLLRLRRLCRSRRIPLYTIVTEWFDPRHNPRGPLSYSALDSEVQRRSLNPRVEGLVCISQFLQTYYRGRGCRTTRVPALLDITDPKWTGADGAQVGGPKPSSRILFSGTPRRDRQDIILQSIRKLREKGVEVQLEYVGSTKADIERLPGVGGDLIAALGPAVRFHGRVPYEQMRRIVASASFGIIVRDQARWSEACFPSKVPEFLAMQIPMICNLTSDLHLYLREGYNAVIAPDPSVDGVRAAIERAVRLEATRYAELRDNARESARGFDGSRFSQAYRELLTPDRSLPCASH